IINIKRSVRMNLRDKMLSLRAHSHSRTLLMNLLERLCYRIIFCAVLFGSWPAFTNSIAADNDRSTTEAESNGPRFDSTSEGHKLYQEGLAYLKAKQYEHAVRYLT